MKKKTVAASLSVVPNLVCGPPIVFAACFALKNRHYDRLLVVAERSRKDG